MTARTDLVGIIEASYRLDLADEQWLSTLVRAAGPHFDRGKGVYGFCFDASMRTYSLTTSPKVGSFLTCSFSASGSSPRSIARLSSLARSRAAVALHSGQVPTV